MEVFPSDSLCMGEISGFDCGNKSQISDGKVVNLIRSSKMRKQEMDMEMRGPSEGHLLLEQRSGASCSDSQLDNQMRSGDSKNEQSIGIEPCISSDNFQRIVDVAENEQSSISGHKNDRLPEFKWLELDEPVALWVKCRGRWETGIRCPRADWPLSTLKSKPICDLKKYCVIFFPETKNYSWTDVMLVRPINEFPEPIAYRSHKVGLSMIKDLTVARQFIMKKLAGSILDILDQVHSAALVDAARDERVWKEFAMDISQCNQYSDVGRLLSKFQSMLSQSYINNVWLQHSHHIWVHQCQIVDRAEAVEILKEELVEAILWNSISSLQNATLSSSFAADWTIWKHDMMKLLVKSPSNPDSAISEKRNCENQLSIGNEVSHKRAKLEVRRADAHAGFAETGGPIHDVTVEIDSEFFNNRETVESATVSSELSKDEDVSAGTVPLVSADLWSDIVVETTQSRTFPCKDTVMAPTDLSTLDKTLNPGNKSQQCIAFIESKGRQCVRWANQGDVYCCVHVTSRFGTSVKADINTSVGAQPCAGTTVHGTKCKHRSLPGSMFCKKHRMQLDSKNNCESKEHVITQKHGDIIRTSDHAYRDSESPLEAGDNRLAMMINGSSFNCKSNLVGNSTRQVSNGWDMVKCIGSNPFESDTNCHESPKYYSLYCEKHIPSWLKRARNGKARIISKDVFNDLLKGCHSLEQKVDLHRACELFYKLFKSIQSMRNPVPMDIQLDWALAEASKVPNVGKLLLMLGSLEKEKLVRIWGFNREDGMDVSSCGMDESPPLSPPSTDDWNNDSNCLRCKICSHEVPDDQELGNHFMEMHNKEAECLFRGYACAICLDSFSNKGILENHVQERHHVSFVEQCMLLQCVRCHSHFGNSEELCLHAVSSHSSELRLKKVDKSHSLLQMNQKKTQVVKVETENASHENNSENCDALHKFSCKFCGMEFDYLPDLGRHHQVAHLGQGLISNRPYKKGHRHFSYRLKSGRLTHPRYKKGLGVASYKTVNRDDVIIKSLQTRSLPTISDVIVQPQSFQVATSGRLSEDRYLEVAKELVHNITKNRPRPSNRDILDVARTACCSVSLKASLEGKYGLLPERFFLKAAKLASEHNIQVEWHLEGFACSKGCRRFKEPDLFSPAMPCAEGQFCRGPFLSSNSVDKRWNVDECHFVIDSNDLREVPLKKTATICNDISFGREVTPVPCVIDEDMLDSHGFKQWESFEYITRPSLSESDSFNECLRLGCTCPPSACCSESCDHVYLFDLDFEDAKDMYGRPMHGKCAYDDKGRIILEEGYLVYECNDKCNCSKTCSSRVLQKGLKLKLEIFRTISKGWAVRAAEPILRGMFVCEYIGEVLDFQEANRRRLRYGEEGCGYMFNLTHHINDMGRLFERDNNFVIDATKFGNVSRFINHSCTSNLVNYQVVVESLEPRRAHIGLFASRDIAVGEELTFNYRYELRTGAGHPCGCESLNCRGRLY